MAEDVANLVVQVALENSNFQKNIQTMNRQIRAATAEFKNSTTGLDKYGKGLDGLEAKSKMLSKQVDAQSKILTEYRTKLEESKKRLEENATVQVSLKDKLNNLAREYEKSVEVTGKNSNESKKLKEELEKLTKEYENNEEKIRNNVGTIENWEIKVNNAERKYKDLERSLQGTNKEIDIQSSKWTKLGDKLAGIGEKIDKVGDKMQEVGGKMTKKITTTVVGIGTAATKLNRDLRKSLGSISTLIPGEKERLLELKDDIQEVSILVAKSTDEIANGTYGVISAYGDATDTMKKVELNAKGATAAMATTDDALNLTSAVMKGFGDTSAEANEKVLDLAFQTLKLGQTSFPDLAASMGKVVPQTNELKISQEELFAVFATATGVTGNASEVSTQYQGVLKALMAPTKDMTKLMSKLGVEDGNAMIAKYGLIGAVEEIVKNSKAAKQPLQKYIGSIEGQTLALTLAGEQSDVFKYKLEELKDSAGSMEEAFMEQTGGIDAVGFAFDQSMQRIKVAVQNLGDVLAPALSKIGDLITKTTTKLSELSPQQLELIAQIGFLVAKLGPLIWIGGKLTSGVGGMVSKITKLSTKIGEVGGVTKLFGLGLKALPIAGVVAGVALLSAGVVKLIKHFRSASIGTKEFGDEVSEGTQQAIEGFVDLNEETTRELTELSIKQETLTKEMATSLDNKFRDMSNIIKDNIVESKNEAVKNLTELFAKTESLSEEEKQAIIKSTEEAYEAKRKAIEDADLRVSEILMNAAEGNRELRQEELAEIKEHQQFITENGIKALTDNEVEQRAILERMKENASVISAEQAAEVVKNSVEQKDKVIADAEEQYKKTIAEIIRLRDESGAITEEQAEKMKRAAKEQKQSIIDDAKEMHNKVVEEAQKQAEEHVEYVDWETGEIYSKWDILGQNIRKWWENKKEETKRDAKETSKMIKDGLKEQMEMLGKIPREVAKKGREIYNSLVGELEKIIDKAKEIGRNVMEGLKEGIQNKLSVPVNAIKDAAGKVVSKAREVFDTHSPSREFESIGADNMMGLALGIEENADLAVKAAEKASQLVKEAGFNEAIKRLNIDTGKDNENLLNTIAIVEVQKQKIESLSKEYEKLTNTKAKNKKEAEKLNKERERAKKELESAKTELMKYEREVERATEKIIENHKKAREEMLKEEEKIRDEQIKAVDDLHKSITSALKKRYEEEGKVREDALSKEIKDLDEWKNESLKRINSVYDEKIKKIDESSNRHIRALEEELKALDKSEQERSREEIENEYKSDINKLEDALKYEHDEYNREQIQKEIDRRKKEHEKQLNDWSVEDKKAALNKQIEDIRENAEMEKEILEGKRLEELERIDNLYDFERDVLESKMEDHREYLQQKTDDAQLQAEAEKMIVYNQQEDILDILKQYEPHYEYAGHSLGQRVFDGAKPQLSKLVSMINSIYRALDMDTIKVEDFTHWTKRYDTKPAEIQYNRRYTEDLFDKDFELPNKTVNNVNIYSPKALNAAEQRRAINRELKKLSFEV